MGLPVNGYAISFHLFGFSLNFLNCFNSESFSLSFSLDLFLVIWFQIECSSSSFFFLISALYVFNSALYVDSGHHCLPRHPSPSLYLECPLGLFCIPLLSTQQVETSLSFTSFVPLLQIIVFHFLIFIFFQICSGVSFFFSVESTSQFPYSPCWLKAEDIDITGVCSVIVLSDYAYRFSYSFSSMSCFTYIQIHNFFQSYGESLF